MNEIPMIVSAMIYNFAIGSASIRKLNSDPHPAIKAPIAV